MPNKTFIIVKNYFEGIHCYPKAPEEVAFLRTPHRHIFHVETEIEVFHSDRELEFIMVERELDKFFKGNLDYKSCEMIAIETQAFVKKQYPALYTGERIVNVKVFEDGENGAMIKEY